VKGRQSTQERLAKVQRRETALLRLVKRLRKHAFMYSTGKYCPVCMMDRTLCIGPHRKDCKLEADIKAAEKELNK